MRIRQVVFTAPQVVELQDRELDETAVGPDDVLIETEYSVVSAGTELACLSGRETWFTLPGMPGYGAVGKALAVGAGVSDIEPGQRVFCYGQHVSHTLAGGMTVPVPDTLDPKQAVMARMAQVAFTSRRVSVAELGDTVAVVGLGLVGNLAAQLFGLSGSTVIGIDVDPKRLAVAEECGVEHVVNAAETDPVEAVGDLTGGEMCEAVVEATGLTDQSLVAGRLAGPLGEVILLGSPRKEATVNALEILEQVHLWGNGCVTFKGAHEWRFPRRHDPQRQTKHSLERNVRQYFQFVEKGKLRIEPLISYVADPSECADVYADLGKPASDYVGVVFKWVTSNPHGAGAL